MTSFKGYANDIENERVNIESMCSFLKIDLNPKNQNNVDCIKHIFFKWAHWLNVDSFIFNVIVQELIRHFKALSQSEQLTAPK